MNQIYSVLQQKGGSGKTTTVVNLAGAAARAGKRVLVIDGDPQGNAGTAFGLVPRQLDRTLYEVLWGTVAARDAIVRTEVGVDILPSNNNLWALSGEMPRAAAQVPEFLDPDLLYVRRLTGLAEKYDIILCDTPPSLDWLTRAALAWSDQVILALQTEFFALDAAVDLLETLELVRSAEGLNPNLEVAGVVATMHQERTRLATQVLAEARNLFAQHGIPVFRTVIPRTIRYGEAPAHGLPAVLTTAEPAVAAYYNLAEEVFHVRVDEGQRRVR